MGVKGPAGESVPDPNDARRPALVSQAIRASWFAGCDPTSLATAHAVLDALAAAPEGRLEDMKARADALAAAVEAYDALLLQSARATISETLRGQVADRVRERTRALATAWETARAALDAYRAGEGAPRGEG